MEVLEEAGTPYYYSTRSDGQQLDMVHGTHLTGGMNVAETTDFCRTHGIRLLIDAAHPFAETLHRNLLIAAARLSLPVVRYDRIYPRHTDDITWCRDYDDAVRQLQAQGIQKLLALTGVNTIARLCNYWQQQPQADAAPGTAVGRECWFRILPRAASLQAARQAGFPTDHLIYEEQNDTAALISRLQPEAILTKESGHSGGFDAKVEAARQAAVKVFAVERPPYPPLTTDVTIETVNGPHGLRRTVERLLPEFYPLHSGLTTGTCATAASIAAVLQLQSRQAKGNAPACPSQVSVTLPDGESIPVDVGYGNGYAYVIKDSGDDPDVTRGLEIRVSVAPSEQMSIEGGQGVGVFTLPGFDYPPGSPAINKSPRRMIVENLKPFGRNFTVTISVPDGETIAGRTFNPRLGITGGISIIGVSGIVKPFSEEAFIESIRKCLEVAKAGGVAHLIINSGAKSERFLRSLHPELPRQAFVEYGNYIGATLRMAARLSFPHVTLGVMLGKAVKLAAGQLDTHSRRGTMDKDFIAQMLSEAGCTADLARLTLARELWTLLPPERLATFCDVVIRHCERHCLPLMAQDEQLTILIVGEDGELYGKQ